MTSMVQVARDDAYRKLADEAVAVEKKLSEDVADLRARTASMEKTPPEIE